MPKTANDRLAAVRAEFERSVGDLRSHLEREWGSRGRGVAVGLLSLAAAIGVAVALRLRGVDGADKPAVRSPDA